jgi:outer membrane protein OmpA-like peptidoglycan-associated protein
MNIKLFSRILLFFLFSFFLRFHSFAQENTQAIRQAAVSTVTIKISGPAGNRFGTGFYIGKNLIVSNFHFFKDAVAASCVGDDPARSFEIPGSVAEDEISDLILLKVGGPGNTPLRISTGQPVASESVYIVSRIMGSTQTAEGSLNGFRESGGVKQMQIGAVVSEEQGGAPVLNQAGELVGVSIGSGTSGKRDHLAIPVSYLLQLLNNKSDSVLTFAELNADPEAEALAELSRDAPVEVTALDYKNNILPNEIIIFRGKQSALEFPGKTDSAGKFNLKLPAGEEYEIFILGFKDSTSYNILKIPALGKKEFYKKSFKVEVKFQPPQTFVLDDVNFNTGKATLTPESFSVIDELVKYLQRKDDERIEIGGHTDNVGSAPANLKLSLDRANTVRDYLLSKGIDPSRVTSKGYGSTKPVADNKTADGKAMNRRTEVTVLN